MYIVMEITDQTLTVQCFGAPQCVHVLQFILLPHCIPLLNVDVGDIQQWLCCCFIS